MVCRYLLLFLGHFCSALDGFHNAGRTSGAIVLSGSDHAMSASQSHQIARHAEDFKADDAAAHDIRQAGKTPIKFDRLLKLHDFIATGSLRLRVYNVYRDSHGNKYGMKYGENVAFIDSAAVYGFDGRGGSD